MRFGRLAILAGFALCVGAAAPAPVMAGNEETAALDGAIHEEDPVSDLLRVLSSEDARRYRRIFGLQDEARWSAADRHIAELEDPVLLGHVLAQRYLHPDGYRADFKELKAWMDAYADLPMASGVHDLARRRRGGAKESLRSPTRDGKAGGHHVVARSSDYPGKKRLSKADRAKVDRYHSNLRRLLRNGATKSAKELLQSEGVLRLFDRVEYDRARAALATAYFVDGHDEWALEWAGKAAARSGKWVSEANWTAGLAAWRLGRHDEAARHFEAATRSKGASRWMIAGAAFWAARSHLVGGAPEKVNQWLGVAGAYPRTFYGLLARRLLGLPRAGRWSDPVVDADAVRAVSGTEAGRRALALLQAGESVRAEQELLALARQARPGLARALLAVAARVDLPAVAVRMEALLFPGGGGSDDVAFPLPEWQPNGGFRIDRALVFAVVRQESGFNPRARSWAGASGLMQLMPGTARFVARDGGFRAPRRDALFEPGYNLALGQKYLDMLLNDAAVKGDLFSLAAAWNGGPGNLAKWKREIRHNDDPLLFIESIPAPETRAFIERVLAYFWTYRHRLGQPTPSLDALAAGGWPEYVGLDPNDEDVAMSGSEAGER